MTFRCDRCARCCRHHIVPVTRADVARLCAHTAQGPSTFLELLAPDQVDLTGEPESLADLPGGRRVVALARRDGACVFLRAEGDGTESCSVHAARPASCRAYPFDRPEVPGEPLGVHPAALCPPETGYLSVLRRSKTAGASPTTLEWAQVVSSRDRELYEHAAWILGFNRRQRLRRRLGKARTDPGEFLAMLAVDALAADEPASGEPSDDAFDTAQIGSAKQVEVDE